MYRKLFQVNALAMLFALCGAAVSHAQTVRFVYTEDVDVASDRSTVSVRQLETTPLTAGTVQTYSQHRLSVTSNQTLEILEAYTKKTDGRVIHVDKSQIATQDGAVGRMISYTDIKYKQIPFSDLSVGDTWVLKLRLTQKEHYFPGHFSQQYIVNPNAAEYRYAVTLRAPDTIPLQYFQREFDLQETRANGIVERRWTGHFPAKTRAEDDAADQQSIIPTLMFSTFDNWGTLANISYRGAAPKFAVTPAVQKLADEITAGRSDARSQAEAIYSWVSKNVQYVAVFFGTGRFVPNEADAIISRRFGDCKDHVTLMSALLAAKGIESEWVLINTGNVYQLPSIPMIQAFNHVIVYIPSLSLYADVTSPWTSFGDLPRSDKDKPVLRASAKGTALSRTSSGATPDNVTKIETRLTVASDGTFKGETSTESIGEEANSLRAFVDRTEVQGQDKVFQAYMKPNGITELAMTAPSSRDHQNPYRINTVWAGTKPITLEKGWRPFYGVAPFGTGAGHFFGGVDRGKRTQPVECRAGRISHSMTVTLPQGTSLKKAPEPVNMKSQFYEYTRTWKPSGNTLTIHTQLASTTPRRVCSADIINAINAEIDRDRERLNPVLTFSKAEG